MRTELWSWLLKFELVASHSVTMIALIYFALGLSLAGLAVSAYSHFAHSRSRRKALRQMEILNRGFHEMSSALKDLQAAERENSVKIASAFSIRPRPAEVEAESPHDERKRALGGLKNELQQLRDQMSKTEVTREAAE